MRTRRECRWSGGEIYKRLDRLFAQLSGQPRLEIVPVSETQFAWKDVAAKLTLVRDDVGRVTGAVHEQGGHRPQAPRMP